MPRGEPYIWGVSKAHLAPGCRASLRARSGPRTSPACQTQHMPWSGQNSCFMQRNHGATMWNRAPEQWNSMQPLRGRATCNSCSATLGCLLEQEPCVAWSQGGQSRHHAQHTGPTHCLWVDSKTHRQDWKARSSLWAMSDAPAVQERN